MSDIIYQSVLLGALFHDIGKFIQRGDFGGLNISGKHPEVSATFIKSWGHFLTPWADPTLLENLVARHHESSAFPDDLRAQSAPAEIRALCLLVSRADNYSSAERDADTGSGYFRTTPLTTVLSRLSLRAETQVSYKYYQAKVFSPKNIFPGNEAMLTPAVTGKLAQDFGMAMQDAGKIKWHSFLALYSYLVTILEDYCWCLPSSTQEKLPDVSLYDHLRTTAAIAASMYQYHVALNNFSEEIITDDTAEKFLLLTGDLSGIQRYIFDIAAIGVGGVAKRLRARSFCLSAISAGLAHKIVYDLGLPPVNIITMSGGNFYILLPNTIHVRNYLKNLRVEVNRDFLNSFAGELSLNLAETPFAGQEFRHYNRVQRRAREKLAFSKLNPLSDILQNDAGVWLENAFILEKAKSTGQGYCKSCGKLPAAKTIDDSSVCTLCAQDLRVGTEFPRAKMIVFYNKNPHHPNAIRLPGGLWTLLADKAPTSNENAIIAYHFGSGEIEEFATIPVKKVLWGTFVPNKDGQPMDFDTIAGCSQGKKMLGIIKADVDNLGALFSLGLSDRGTISRVATLSRMLETFFSGWVNHVLAENYPNTYLVYSGGDDLLAVGPWNEAVALISHLRTDFARFAGQNPDVTLSAGIAVVKPTFPIAHGVAAAEENLDKAKNKAPKVIGEGKDQCTFLEETVKWDQLPILLEEARNLTGWIEKGQISTRFVHHLLLYANMFDRYCLNQQIDGLKYIPLLHYDVHRNVKKNTETIEIQKWAHGLANINGESIRHLALIARYALLARRSSNAR
ncbi:MAG: CRISPR-associated protein Cas10/Csm1 [Syntrophomonadaceae bacterium]|nr:CRISPR-associated protein Cas10/Csm1 [Bacillota bacterium]